MEAVELDPVVQIIDQMIERIEKDDKSATENVIPSREDLLNTHLAFIKTVLLL